MYKWLEQQTVHQFVEYDSDRDTVNEIVIYFLEISKTGRISRFRICA